MADDPLDSSLHLSSQIKAESFALFVVIGDSFKEFSLGSSENYNAGYFFHALIFSKTDSRGAALSSPRS